MGNRGRPAALIPAPASCNVGPKEHEVLFNAESDTLGEFFDVSASPEELVTMLPARVGIR
jgi:hypothetical protein